MKQYIYAAITIFSLFALNTFYFYGYYSVMIYPSVVFIVFLVLTLIEVVKNHGKK